MKLPVTLITGTSDDKFTRINKNMQERLPNVQWQQVPQADTMSFEQPSQGLLF